MPLWITSLFKLWMQMRGSGPLVHMVNGSLCSSSFYPEMPTFRSADIRDAARARKAMGEKSFGLRDFNLLLVSLLLLPVGRVRECERDAGLDKTVSFDRSIRNWSAMLSTVRYVGSNLDHEQFNLQFSEGRIPLSSERALKRDGAIFLRIVLGRQAGWDCVFLSCGEAKVKVTTCPGRMCSLCFTSKTGKI